jgi:urease accessory protein
MLYKRILFAATVLVLASVSSVAAYAHPGHVDGAGFGLGFLHPLNGLDHMLAMLAVGLWAVQAGGRNLWIMPAIFVAALLAGGLAGMEGAPSMEIGVAGSLVVLGGAIFLAQRVPLWLGGFAVGLMGLLHGLAHGVEIPLAGSAAGYVAGFVVACLVLHGAGMILGLAGRSEFWKQAIRLGGGATAALGVLYLAGTL